MCFCWLYKELTFEDNKDTLNLKGALYKINSPLVVAAQYQLLHQNKTACRPHLPFPLALQKTLFIENYATLKKRYNPM